MLTGKDGWMDKNGHLVWNNGNWTEYASESQMKIADIMRSTLTGSEQFTKLVRSGFDITVTIDEVNAPTSKNGDILMGSTNKKHVNYRVSVMYFFVREEDVELFDLILDNVKISPHDRQ